MSKHCVPETIYPPHVRLGAHYVFISVADTVSGVEMVETVAAHLTSTVTFRIISKRVGFFVEELPEGPNGRKEAKDKADDSKVKWNGMVL